MVIQERELLEKVIEWQAKASSESDPFNKYVSMFIAYNVFYNLYAKKKSENPNVDFAFRDNERAADTMTLVEPNQLFPSLEADLEEYLSIIPVFREEHWSKPNSLAKVPISQALKKNFDAGNKKETIDMLIKWLYKVRCNLVHGEKSYNDPSQRKLLETSAKLLSEILRHLVSRYKQTYGI